MQERRVTIAGENRALPDPFLVVATQNPIEHEGTYPLPEAQLDRFMFSLDLDYPARDEEIEIVRRTTIGDFRADSPPSSPAQDILAIQTARPRDAGGRSHPRLRGRPDRRHPAQTRRRRQDRRDLHRVGRRSARIAVSDSRRQSASP